MTYSEAGYEDYYDYGDETGGEYTEAGYEEYYEEESDIKDDGIEDSAPVSSGDLPGETTTAPEETGEQHSYTEEEEEEEHSYTEEEGEQTNDERDEQVDSADPATTVASDFVSRKTYKTCFLSCDKLSYFTMKEEEETRDYENYDDEEEDYQGPDVDEKTSEEADTNENRDAYEEDPNYNEEEVKYEEPYEESNGEDPETER